MGADVQLRPFSLLLCHQDHVHCLVDGPSIPSMLLHTVETVSLGHGLINSSHMCRVPRFSTTTLSERPTSPSTPRPLNQVSLLPPPLTVSLYAPRYRKALAATETDHALM